MGVIFVAFLIWLFVQVVAGIILKFIVNGRQVLTNRSWELFQKELEHPALTVDDDTLYCERVTRLQLRYICEHPWIINFFYPYYCKTVNGEALIWRWSKHAKLAKKTYKSLKRAKYYSDDSVHL